MASAAFDALKAALPEVSDLHVPSRKVGELGANSNRIRAVGRAQTVLLSSHFERYIYQVNEEAVAFLNDARVVPAKLPDPLRVLHSKEPLDQLAETAWGNRAKQLESFVASDGWLWTLNATGTLVHSRLLAWMSSPKPKNLVRYFNYWAIPDIFAAITRKPQTRKRLWLGVEELVDRRNSIAHGDYSAQATASDVRRFERSVLIFCGRADRELGKAISRITGGPLPW